MFFPVGSQEMRKSWRVFYSLDDYDRRGMCTNIASTTSLHGAAPDLVCVALHRRLGSTCRKEKGKFMIPISECLHFRDCALSDLLTIYSVYTQYKRLKDDDAR